MPEPTPASGPGTYRSIFLGHSSITARETLTMATSSMPAGTILTACCPQDSRADAGQEPGHDDVRQIGDEAADPEQPQQHLHAAGHDGDEGELGQIAAVVGEDRGDDDRHGDARTADQHPGAAEHGGHQTDDDEAVKAGDRSDAGQDAQGRDDRHRGGEPDGAGLQIGPEFFPAVGLAFFGLQDLQHGSSSFTLPLWPAPSSDNESVFRPDPPIPPQEGSSDCLELSPPARRGAPGAAVQPSGRPAGFRQER